MLNPAPANDNVDLEHITKCEFYSPNETELGRLTHLPVESIDQIKDAAHSLVDQGVKNVIVTIGSRGALWVCADHEELIPSYKVNAVDSIGAGDSFVGAFAHYYTNGEDIPTALRHANAYAAVTVTTVSYTHLPDPITSCNSLHVFCHYMFLLNLGVNRVTLLNTSNYKPLSL